MDQPPARVLVTGATGFVGSAIIARLLARGHSVHATYRPQSRHKLPPFADRIHLFEAHLDDDSHTAFERAAEGCAFAVHAAFPMSEDVPLERMLKASVAGTLTVLNACARAGVKHIVYVSSHTAITQNGSDSDKQFSESDWNSASTRRHLPTAYAKVEAERTAWTWAQQHHDVRLIAVNPVAIWGKSLIPGDVAVGPAKEFLIALAAGDMKGVVDLSLPVVHIRDVVNVILRLLFFEGAAAGRYIICPDTGKNCPLHIRDMVPRMWEMGLKPPTYDLTNPTFSRAIKLASYINPGGASGQFLRANLGVHVRLSNSKVRSLFPDLQFVNVDDALRETMYELIDLGLVKVETLPPRSVAVHSSVLESAPS